MDINERRKFLRFGLSSVIKITIGDQQLEYPCRDISAGGFKVDYIEGLKLGQIVKVVVDFECGLFSTLAQVKWIDKEKGIGFEFVDRNE